MDTSETPNTANTNQAEGSSTETGSQTSNLSRYGQHLLCSSVLISHWDSLSRVLNPVPDKDLSEIVIFQFQYTAQLCIHVASQSSSWL